MAENIIKQHCKTTGESIRSLDEAVGGGGQVAKFAAGARSLPLPLAARLSEHTGIPIEKLLDSDQALEARAIFAAVARSL
mgnify:CR=1 FL=1